MKHYEELWEASEIVSITSDTTSVEEKKLFISEKIKELATNNPNNFEIFGEVLFKLCGLSHVLNINTFTALLKQMQNEKISLMED